MLLFVLRRTVIFGWVLLFCGSLATGHAQARDTRAHDARPQAAQVLFVCEHGNVKSLMAASYFNQQAGKLRLPYRAVSRGVAPDSTTVPPLILEGLRADGIDASGFHPSAVQASDVASPRLVVTIGTKLPLAAQPSTGVRIEQWNDVPPTSEGFAGTRDSLKEHVRKLIEALEKR